MNLYQHARLTPRGRALLVERVIHHGLRVEEAAHAAGVSVRTAYYYVANLQILWSNDIALYAVFILNKSDEC